MKKAISIITCAFLLMTMFTAGALAGMDKTVSKDVREELQATAVYVMNQYLKTTEAGNMYMNAQYIAPIAKSGIACGEIKDKYKTDLKTVLDANGGKLLYQGEESAGSYALAIQALEAMGQDASNFMGYNLFSALGGVKVLDSNPYMMAYALEVVHAYGDKINNTKLENDLLKAITALFKEEGNEAGWDNWGINADNNSVMMTALAPYYSTNETVKAQMDKALAYNETQKSKDGYLNWGSANANSTALALEALLAVQDEQGAAEAYAMLLNFKSASVKGAYNYDGEANLYSSAGALTGLSAYYEFLAAKEEADKPVQPEKPDKPSEVPVQPEQPNGSGLEQPVIPQTGDMGGRIVMVGAMALLGAAGSLLLKKKEQ